jgi:hypothetical protein
MWGDEEENDTGSTESEDAQELQEPQIEQEVAESDEWMQKGLTDDDGEKR